MDSQSDPNSKPKTPASEHVSHAHALLQSLRQRIGEHPELAEAIRKLELALSTLTVETGGML
jgi:hypothetical protein